MLRNESDLVLAANQAMDVCSQITVYLLALENAASRYSGYRSPLKLKWPYNVTILEVREKELLVGLSGTETISYKIANYYEPDDEAFTEGYGVSNVSGYSSCVKDVKVDQYLCIPFKCLLRTKAEMAEDTKKIVDIWTEKDKAEAKAYEITRLEEQLAAVRAS